MHDIKKCEMAYRLADGGGWSIQAIASELNMPYGTVRNWLKYPDRYSPYLDEVALERAQFDRSVYDNLSNYEVNVFWKRAADRIAGDLAEYNFDDGSRLLGKTMTELMFLTGLSQENVEDHIGTIRRKAIA